MDGKTAVLTNLDVVTDRGSADWSDLWKKEDYWAIWLGFIVLIVGLFLFLPDKPRVRSAVSSGHESSRWSVAIPIPVSERIL